MKFDFLVNTIHDTHIALQQSAVKAINRHITIRNWLIGLYIVEYEQKGEDRAAYGEKLIETLANAININGLSVGNLKIYRQFYLAYPQIGQTLSGFFKSNPQIGQSLTGQLQFPYIKEVEISQSLAIQFDIIENEVRTPPDKLITRLSFTHLVLLMPISDPLKRTFYEVECMKSNWSVRELKRQINTLYYERSGLSSKPEKLAATVAENAEPLNPADIVRNVYAFEFLGLKTKDIVKETDLETALLDNLQEFLLEMGHGFCLEGRQKRILIGDEYFFIDIVFYHRVLKCHILVDLKVEAFNHSNVGQLNTYINYFKKEVVLNDDNPPVGILLVTHKNDALVEYATGNMDNKLFVSKYLLKLPDKKQIEDFVKQELKRL